MKVLIILILSVTILTLIVALVYNETVSTNAMLYEIDSLENTSDNILRIRENFKDLYGNKITKGEPITYKEVSSLPTEGYKENQTIYNITDHKVYTATEIVTGPYSWKAHY